MFTLPGFTLKKISLSKFDFLKPFIPLSGINGFYIHGPIKIKGNTFLSQTIHTLVGV